MIDVNNKYTKMQRNFFEEMASQMAVGNHKEHNSNPDYWNILLGDLNDIVLTGDEVALDFGCGSGRNVMNLLEKWNWRRVDGIDISENNIKEATKLTKSYFLNNNSKEFTYYTNNGVDLQPLKDNEYNFIMSTIVLQHICVYEIRYNILKEMFRILKPNGQLSFQMGYGLNPEYGTIPYHQNYYDAKGTNSDCDVRVEDPKQIIDDLEKIGYKGISTEITPSWSNRVHNNWIYVKAHK